MQIAAETTTSPSLRSAAISDSSAISTHSHLSRCKVIRRNGAVVGFGPSKIPLAVTKAFLDINAGPGAASTRIRELIGTLAESVVGALVRRQPAGGAFHIEDIQDQVELESIRSGEHGIARAYVLYRGKSARARAQETVHKKGAAVAECPAPGPTLWRVR